MRKLLGLVFSALLLSVLAIGLQADEPDGDVSAYLQGAHISLEDVEAKLTNAGFEIVTTFKSIKKGKTVVFTCPTLKKEAASKPMRANIAVLRIFVDDQEQTISIANPVYFGKAYMQDDYKHETFSAVKAKLEKEFPGLKGSEDAMEFDDLGDFRFTMMHPRYDEVEVVGEGTNDELLEKARSYKKGKMLSFELKITDETTLLGYAIGRGTERFVKKIGRNNAGLLPWPIVINDGKATILQAEYYIAMNYPMLGMMQFGGIASAPGNVIKDLKKPFK
ncbi:hypothetical protein N9A28_08020 [Sulfurimonas sp.]|nr:hypothetical protein [Sulfurimonas sp.]